MMGPRIKTISSGSFFRVDFPVKTSLALLGLCEESFRLPLCPPRDETREALRAALRGLGLLGV